MIKVGSDFSGVGAFNQALMRLGVEYTEVFACDMDKYARQTFIHNYGEPGYYPMDVYEREIPSESLDIYMTSPPCQAFSLAGKRLGKDDKRGILFFNSHEFIQVNKPRYFIFENVKGLLSDDGGKTFSEWCNMLGGKSVNGNPVIFPFEESVPYHIYWKVLNAKHHGVPQNRERVFIIGIRDDKDNTFRWPVEEQLTKRLKDVLQEDVDDKYFLSEKMINVLSHHNNPIIENDTPDNSNTIQASYFKMGGRDQQYLKVTNFQGNDIANTIRTGGKGSMTDKHNWDTIKIKSATSKGYEEAIIGAFRGRYSDNISDTPTEQRLEINNQGTSNTITSVQKDNVVIETHRIRRLTPRECFRLMDFPDTFTWPVSDSQAYKQAGNSIVVNVLYKILKNLSL
jgi:DNA (cytosine-5)-methyltransferase 1